MFTPKQRYVLLSAALAALCSTATFAAEPAAADEPVAPPPAPAADELPPPADEPPMTVEPAPSDHEPDPEPLRQSTNAAGGRNRGPLMRLLGRTGLAGPLEDARINVFGHVEGSWTHNFDDPALDLNLGRIFDLEHDDPTLNQLSLNVERQVQVTPDRTDVGFRVEWLYGGDARFTQANGLFDHYNVDFEEGDTDGSGVIDADEPGPDDIAGPDEQWDLLQAYVDLGLPVGRGLRVRAGKFAYFKTIDPVASPLYSRSFSFGGALPFTLTGAYGTYAVSDDLTVEAGIARGWDQALEDNNGAVSFFGSVRYDLSERTRLAVKFITGPELDGDNGNFTTALDGTLSQRVSDRLTLSLNGMIAFQGGDEPDGPQLVTANGTSIQFERDVAPGTEWYGVAGYALYRVNNMLGVNGRLEWFRDEDGATTLVSQNLYGATVGLTITPFPNDETLSTLLVRPEVRYDRSSEDYFDGFEDDDQLTFALEGVFAF